jgi:hypothetical protein
VSQALIAQAGVFAGTDHVSGLRKTASGDFPAAKFVANHLSKTAIAGGLARWAGGTIGSGLMASSLP